MALKSFYYFFISAHNVVHNNRYQEWGHYILTFFVTTPLSAAVRELHVPLSGGSMNFKPDAVEFLLSGVVLMPIHKF